VCFVSVFVLGGGQMTRKLNRILPGGWKLFLAVFLAGLLIFISAGHTPAEASNCQTYHTVRRGENLFRISMRYGTTINAIAAANNISNPDVIYAGQTLCIPPATGTGGQPTGMVVNCYFLNVRNGPAVIYGVLDIVPQGTQMQVLGRNSYATWLQVRTPAGQIGWVNAYYLRVPGPIYNLPIVG
jgi:LysM repeat protein